MADRFWFERLRCLLVGYAKICGSFAVDGSGAPENVYGRGFSVAKTDVGIYTITFDDAYAKLISAVASVQNVTPTNIDWTVKFLEYSVADKTLRLVTLLNQPGGPTSAVPTDMGQDDDNRVHFDLTFTVSDLD